MPTSLKPDVSAEYSPGASEGRMLTLKQPIPRYLLDIAAKKRAERDARWREQFNGSPDKAPVSSQFAPAAPAGQLEREVVMIYVSFTTNTNNNNGEVASMTNLPKLTAGDLYNMMFDKNAFGTVAHYYDTVTNGIAQVVPAQTNTEQPGIIFVELPGPHGNWGRKGELRSDLVIPALRKASIDGEIDFSNFDRNADGNITTDELSIGLIVHGYETSFGGLDPSFPSIWGHAWSFNPETINGVKLSHYFVEGAYQVRAPSPKPLTIGIIAHELGHSCFGFLDLYDVDGPDAGIGNWSLMAGGTWGAKAEEQDGTTPTGLDAYHLYGGNSSVRLIDPKPLAANNTLDGLGSEYAKLPTSNPNQYFLLQPRGNTGYDQGLQIDFSTAWEPGLLVYLVDDNITNNGENFPSNSLSYHNHYHVAVVDADWPYAKRNDPYGIMGSASSSSNLFRAGTRDFLNDSADRPSSKIYAARGDRYPTLSSGLSISSITGAINGSGDTGSASASFTVVNIPPQITGHPQSQTVASGGSVSFSVTADGTAPLSYQWQKSANYETGWNNISGAVSATYTFTARMSDNNASFRAVVSNSHSTQSNAAVLTVTGGGGDGDDGAGIGCNAGFGILALVSVAGVLLRGRIF